MDRRAAPGQSRPMTSWPGPPWSGAIDAFLLAFPALFSIVNPLGGALIYAQVTAEIARGARARLARRVGLYSALVMLIALWGGTYVLAFFGISLAALRVAGGFVVAQTAYGLLSAPERNEMRKQEQASTLVNPEAGAFFPLTMPFTAGPGTISVAIALGASRPSRPAELAPFFLGASGAALATAITVWLAYRSADRLVSAMGPTRAQTLSRLAAFLLLCIGVQVLIAGVTEVFAPLLAAGR